MSSTTLDAECQPGLVNEREVAAFLCRYPDFFEHNPEILTELASVEMHGIQSSGNCIRNTTADEYAGVAADEVEDLIPTSFGMWHFIGEFPGVARFPMDQWLMHNAPTFSAKTWCKLAIRIAQEAPYILRGLLEVAEDLERDLVDWIPPKGILRNTEDWDMDDDEVQEWPAAHQWYQQTGNDEANSWHDASSSSWQ